MKVQQQCCVGTKGELSTSYGETRFHFTRPLPPSRPLEQRRLENKNISRRSCPVLTLHPSVTDLHTLVRIYRRKKFRFNDI